MKSLDRRIAGLDVHRMLYVLTVLIERDDGTVAKHPRSFGGFQCDRRALVAWLFELDVNLVVMESTGIYWKSIYAALEQAGIPAHGVNARQARNVPGRKTDISDDTQGIDRERAATAEGVNAHARNRGLQQRGVRGRTKVRNVLLLHALAHNLMRTLALVPEVLGLGTVAPEMAVMTG